ncbi:GDSL esterase/lipase [Melia azedarach]|nr:GDSL esterase/lipase [Melia azedarach]
MGKQETTTSEREIFSISGPLHLTAVDWKNPHHRRSVAASLVQGVYILERDRQANRQGHQAQASPWWNFFHFQLIRGLIDDADHSIFGAIYEYNPHVFDCNNNAPKYIISFRGTLNKPDSRSRDLELDLKCISNKLHQSSRFHLAIQAVQDVVNFAGPANVWLAGHSLGSAIALLIGKNITKVGHPMETFLFNPPFFSAPIERIQNEKLKHGIRFASSVVKAGFALAVKGTQNQENDLHKFYALAEWIPQLFLNPADHICSEYIGYFQHRKKMEEIGASKIERLATQHSVGSLISGVLGSDSEALHLLPSANLTINLSYCPDFKRAHGIHQWWDPNFHGQSELHLFR